MKNIRNKVVLITGGSKGLGLELAKQLTKQHCKLALCARSMEELQKAKAEVDRLGGSVFISPCDVADKVSVKKLIQQVINHYGHLDIVINDAGIMIVGAMESYRDKEYEDAMNVMYWGIVNTTLAVLPHMKQRQEGQIINITSIGGKVSIPHMLPYTSAKFAAVGFSQGITAELRKDNIYVTTIIPGLMRTGSYTNALFQKDNKNEFKLFSMMSTAPLITISAEKAARETLKAANRKAAVKVIGLPAKILKELYHFLPETMISFFGFVSKYLPATKEKTDFEKGEAIRQKFSDAEMSVFEEIGKYVQMKHQPTTKLH